jgi:multiple sugar transport system permease protein
MAITVHTLPKTIARWRAKYRRRWLPLWFLLPVGLVVGAVIGYPVVRALILSLFSYNPLSGATEYVGLQNYTTVLADPVFRGAALRTVIWTFGVVIAQFLFGLLGAVLLNQSFPGRGLVRGLVLIPWATPSVLAAMMWLWLLDSNYGVINDLLGRIGLGALAYAWFSLPTTALPALMLIDFWQGVPFFAVMLLAALQTIPSDIIEAAVLDGGNRWQIFWRITFPLLLPTVLITTLLRVIWTASYIDLILIITQGGPGIATLTVPAYAYYAAYSDFAFGKATAAAVLQAVVLLVIVIVYLRLLSRKGALE